MMIPQYVYAPIKNQRIRVLGMIQAVMAQNIFKKKQQVGVQKNTIRSIWKRFQQSDNTVNRPLPGRPRVTSFCQDSHIRLDCFQTASLTLIATPVLDA